MVLGCIRWGGSGLWWPRWYQSLLGPLPCLEVVLPDRMGERRVVAVARKLYRLGVRRVVTPPEFPHWMCLMQEGIRPVDQSPFCQALAPRLVELALIDQGRELTSATVVFRGRQVTRSLRTAVLDLCTKVGQVAVDVPQGGQQMREELWRSFGLSDWVPSGQDCPPVAVHFSPTEGGGDQVFSLYGTTVDLSPYRLSTGAYEVPIDLEETSFLALLWDCGRLKLEDVEISTQETT